MDKLPKGWSIEPIENVFKVKSGAFLPSKKLIPNGRFPVYGGNGITGSFDNFNLSEENIIIGRVGANCGNVRFVKGNVWVTDNAFYISEYKNDIDKKYLSVFLQFVDLGSTANQAAQPVISYKSIKSIPIPLPPLPEQKRIVSKLDALFERIDKSMALLEENIKHTESLMASALDEVFLELESKYELQPLENVIRVINGRAYKKQEMLNSGKYKLLRVGNFFTSQSWYYSDLELEPDKYCDKGDLLFAWSASFGPKIWDGDKTIFHYHIWKMEPINNLIEKEFAYYLLQRDTIKIKEEGGRGVGMVHITKGGIEKRKIVVPPNKEQLKAVKMIKSLFDNLTKLQTEQQDKLKNIKALKESILDKAFKGKI